MFFFSSLFYSVPHALTLRLRNKPQFQSILKKFYLVWRHLRARPLLLVPCALVLGKWQGRTFRYLLWGGFSFTMGTRTHPCIDISHPPFCAARPLYRSKWVHFPIPSVGVAYDFIKVKLFINPPFYSTKSHHHCRQDRAGQEARQTRAIKCTMYDNFQYQALICLRRSTGFE